MLNSILGAHLSSRLKSQSILAKTKIMISQKAPIVSFTATPYFKEGSLDNLLAYLTSRATFPGSCKASPEPWLLNRILLSVERRSEVTQAEILWGFRPDRTKLLGRWVGSGLAGKSFSKIIRIGLWKSGFVRARVELISVWVTSRSR